jgi:Rieske Fe-S protein
VTELDQRPADTVPSDAVSTGPSRRQVLLTGGVVVAAAAVTAACGSSSATSTSSPAAAGGSAPAGTASSASSASASADDSKVAVADIPVGGGVILADKKVVVTQPTAGEFKAFSAVCTHQGCAVASVADGVIVCPCHNSQFLGIRRLGEGRPAALASVAVTVSGDQVSVSA